MRKIFVVGAFSGKNYGDEAILEATMADFIRTCPSEFIVPTRNPEYIASQYKEYSITPVSIEFGRNYLKILIIALNLSRYLLKADLVLITSSLLYEYKWYRFRENPLLGIFPLVLMTKILRRPMGYYSVGIGPLYSGVIKYFVKIISNLMDFIILRDHDSKKLLIELGVNKTIHVTADPVVNCQSANPERLDAPTIGVNVNYYIDSLLDNKMRESDFTSIIANTLDRIIENLNVNVLFLVFCPYDKEITKSVFNRLRNRERAKITKFERYNHREMLGLIGSLEMLIGMRLHAIIFAGATGTPFVGINYDPKVRGFVSMLKEEENLIEFSELRVENLYRKITHIWFCRKEKREELKNKMKTIMRDAQKSAEIALKYSK